MKFVKGEIGREKGSIGGNSEQHAAARRGICGRGETRGRDHVTINTGKGGLGVVGGTGGRERQMGAGGGRGEAGEGTYSDMSGTGRDWGRRGGRGKTGWDEGGAAERTRSLLEKGRGRVVRPTVSDGRGRGW